MTSSTLERGARLVAESLRPLLQHLASTDPGGAAIKGFVAELGWQLPDPVPPSLLQLRGSLVQLVQNCSKIALIEAASADSDDPSQQEIAAFAGVLTALSAFVSQLVQLGSRLVAELPPPFVAATQIDKDLVKRLTDALIVEIAYDRMPTLARALRFIGLFDISEQLADAGKFQPTFVSRQIRWDRITALMQKPGEVFADVYGWGTPNLKLDPLFEALQSLSIALDAHGTYDFPSKGFIQAVAPGVDPATAKVDLAYEMPLVDVGLASLSVALTSIPKSNAAELQGIALALTGAGGTKEISIPLTPTVSLVLGGSLDASLGAALAWRPGQPISFTSDFDGSRSPITGGEFYVGLSYQVLSDKDILTPLSIPGGSRLEVRSGLFRTGVRVGSGDPVDLLLEAAIKDGRFILATDEADGFLASLLPPGGIQSNFQLGALFSSIHGFHFEGSATLELNLPVHIQLGPVEIQSLYVIVGFKDAEVPIEVSSAITGQLGPLSAVVDRLGFTAHFKFPGSGGNLGPVNLDLGFKPPNGVGLAVDAGVVKGGGYLFLDSDKGEYAGVLELMFADIVSLKAIGLITTKMPDGSPGFSLLVIITAEFGTGIQLGFGFTLIGVGGLLGLNRTVRLEPLADGVRTGAVNNIMFPQDIVANAPRIISDLRTIFPPEQGKFLIGPMAKLGWGTPTLISLSLGIIIEVPGNLAILGVLRCILPTSDAPILVLQVAFLGAIEFDKKRLWLFAGLFESRVLFVTLEGEMGVLAAFGDDANFVISVGGFHPQFTPPPLPFPIPKRLAIDLLNEPGERIRVEGYFAVTTNTVQFGARAELVFGFDDFGLHGHLGFDALFQFSPFYFIIHVSADLSLDAFGVGLFSVDLDFSLEGPTPYRAHGRGSVSLLFFDISADFDISWGESRDTTLPPIEILPVLAAEFNKLENWKAFVPANANLLVSLRHLDAANEGLVLHPIGTLRVSQRYVPLDSNLDKVGAQKPHDAKHFTLRVTSADLSKTMDVPEQFAPAQFHDMSNADKLSKPAYVSEHGGMELSASGQQLNSSQAVKRIDRYEQIIIDTNFKRFSRKFRNYSGVLFDLFLRGNAVSKSTLSLKYKQQMQPFADTIKAGADSFAVAFTNNNKTYKDEAVFTSVFAAQDYMASTITNDPGLTDSLHVIPNSEVNRAA